jgi:major membrane immunogen (membrane-anchored lipoprotein)
MIKVKFAIVLMASMMLAACGNSTENNQQEGGAPTTTQPSPDGSISPDAISSPETAGNPTPTVDSKIKFEKESHEFGDVAEGEKMEYTYKFTNEGTADLVVTNARAGCGCTVPDWTKTPIKPGEGGVIKVVFDSEGRSGFNDKTVTVETNGNPASVVLRFTAQVIAKKK